MILEDLRAEDLATPQEKRWALLLGAGTWPEVRRCVLTSGAGWSCLLDGGCTCDFALRMHPHTRTGQRSPHYWAGLPCLQVLRRLVLTRAQDEDNPDQ